MSLTNRIGYLSSISLFVIGIAYAVVVGVGISEAGFDEAIVDPTLAVMEVLTLLSAPLVVVVMAAIYETASRDRKIFAVLALVFAGIMAGLSSAVHFVTLTFGRQTNFRVLDWPSALYALELLAWLGAIGPVVGDMALRRIGMLGYGIGLPVAALVLSRFFQQRARDQ